MSDIKKLLSELEEAGKMTDCERGALMEYLSLISERFDPCSCDSIFINLAIQELKDLQAENAELRKQSEWISVDDFELHLKDGDLCFVYFPCSRIKKCYLNDYRGYGGDGVYWQDMDGDDLPMLNTKFIKVETPAPPKEK